MAALTSSIENQDIQSARRCKHSLRRVLDRFERAQVQFQEADRRSRCLALDFTNSFVAFLGATSRHPDLCWAMLCQFERGLLAQSTVGARDEDHFTLEGWDVGAWIEGDA